MIGKITHTNLYLTFLLIIILTASTGCGPFSPSPAPQAQVLFNGKDFSGWTVKSTPADKDKRFWKIEDGSILADSMGCADHDYIWLLTENDYCDFILNLRFQACRESPGNSGVQIRSRYDDNASWLDGPQIDINPPEPWRTGMMWDETRDNLRWIFPDLPLGKWVDPSMADPGLLFYYPDDSPAWNDLQITAVGTKITAVLNGVKITDYDGRGVLDDSIHKKYNVGLCGKIALQIHKNDRLKIRFKDISIKPLN
jgi:hypothetical protein